MPSMSLKKLSTVYLILIFACWLVALSFFTPVLLESPSLLKNAKLRTTSNLPSHTENESLAIVVGLPKSGTTSLYHYFSCNGFDTTHYCCCGSNDTQYPCENGRTMSSQLVENLNSGLSLLHGITGTVHAQLDGELFDNQDQPYFLPQQYYLEQLHAAAPRATWILPLRSPQSWKTSVEAWLDMGKRLKQAHQYHNPNSVLADFLVDFYQLHTETVKEACQRYHRKCVVVQVDENAGNVLEKTFPGTRASCWGRHNEGPFFQVISPP